MSDFEGRARKQVLAAEEGEEPDKVVQSAPQTMAEGAAPRDEEEETFPSWHLQQVGLVRTQRTFAARVSGCDLAGFDWIAL